MTPPWREGLISKLRLCHAVDLSDAELIRCLGACSGGGQLIALAVRLRESGDLKMEDLK